MSDSNDTQTLTGFVKSAETLSSERSAVDDLVQKWNEKIRSLRLAVEAWVRTEGDNNDRRPLELGFRDTIVVRYGDSDESKFSPTDEVRYDLKIEALALLPRLLEDLRLAIDCEVTRLRRLKVMTDFKELKRCLKAPFVNPHE